MHTANDYLRRWETVRSGHNYISLPTVAEDKMDIFRDRFLRKMGYDVDPKYLAFLRQIGALRRTAVRYMHRRKHFTAKTLQTMT